MDRRETYLSLMKGMFEELKNEEMLIVFNLALILKTEKHQENSIIKRCSMVKLVTRLSKKTRSKHDSEEILLIFFMLNRLEPKCLISCH